MTDYFAIRKFRGTCSFVEMPKGHMSIFWNDKVVHAHLSKCWRDTWSGKGWEPLL